MDIDIISRYQLFECVALLVAARATPRVTPPIIGENVTTSRTDIDNLFIAFPIATRSSLTAPMRRDTKKLLHIYIDVMNKMRYRYWTY